MAVGQCFAPLSKAHTDLEKRRMWTLESPDGTSLARKTLLSGCVRCQGSPLPCDGFMPIPTVSGGVSRDAKNFVGELEILMEFGDL